MTNDLERQYRQLLRWYPRAWRAAHGEALLGTLMDGADAQDRTVTARGEWRSFAAAGTSARLDRLLMQPVRDAAATVALSMGAGAALIVFMVSSWAPWHGGEVGYLFGPSYARFGPFWDLGPLVEVFWFAALIAALAGRWDIGRVALLASIPVAVLMPYLARSITKPLMSLDWATLVYSGVCALIAALGVPRTRWPLAAATAGWALITWTCYAYERPVGTLIWEPSSSLWDRLVWPWYLTASAIGVVALLALSRLWTATFTLLLAVVPMIATFDLSSLTGRFRENGDPWVLTVPVVVGLAALLLASTGALRLPRWRRSSTRTTPLA